MHGCLKRYTDPSSLRKHVKNHSKEEQDQYKACRERTLGTEQRWLETNYQSLVGGADCFYRPDNDLEQFRPGWFFMMQLSDIFQFICKYLRSNQVVRK